MYVYKCFDIWLQEPVWFAVRHEGTFGVIMVTINMFPALRLPAVQFAT